MNEDDFSLDIEPIEPTVEPANEDSSRVEDALLEGFDAIDETNTIKPVNQTNEHILSDNWLEDPKPSKEEIEAFEQQIQQQERQKQLAPIADSYGYKNVDDYIAAVKEVTKEQLRQEGYSDDLDNLANQVLEQNFTKQHEANQEQQLQDLVDIFEAHNGRRMTSKDVIDPQVFQMAAANGRSLADQYLIHEAGLKQKADKQDADFLAGFEGKTKPRGMRW